MKSIITFLTIAFFLGSCGSNNNVGKTFYENRNSKEIIANSLLDASLGNNKDYSVKDTYEKKSPYINNEELDKEELKKALKLSSDQTKKFDLIYLDYNNRKEEIVNSLSFDDYEKEKKIETIIKKRDDQLVKILDEFQSQIYFNLKNQK